MIFRDFVTGGTFDKEYNELNGELYSNDSHILEMLKGTRCKADLQVRRLMMTGSLSMTEEVRKIAPQNCREAVGERIIIMHGTDSWSHPEILITNKQGLD